MRLTPDVNNNSNNKHHYLMRRGYEPYLELDRQLWVPLKLLRLVELCSMLLVVNVNRDCYCILGDIHLSFWRSDDSKYYSRHRHRYLQNADTDTATTWKNGFHCQALMVIQKCRLRAADETKRKLWQLSPIHESCKPQV